MLKENINQKKTVKEVEATSTDKTNNQRKEEKVITEVKDLSIKDILGKDDLLQIFGSEDNVSVYAKSNMVLRTDGVTNVVTTTGDDVRLYQHINDIKHNTVKSNNIVVINKTVKGPVRETMYQCYYDKAIVSEITSKGLDQSSMIGLWCKGILNKCKDVNTVAYKTVIVNRLSSPRIYKGSRGSNQNSHFMTVITLLS